MSQNTGFPKRVRHPLPLNLFVHILTCPAAHAPETTPTKHHSVAERRSVQWQDAELDILSANSQSEFMSSFCSGGHHGIAGRKGRWRRTRSVALPASTTFPFVGGSKKGKFGFAGTPRRNCGETLYRAGFPFGRSL